MFPHLHRLLRIRWEIRADIHEDFLTLDAHSSAGGVARSGERCHGFANRRQAVENVHSGEAPVDQTRSAPVDADHESIPRGVGQYVLAPGAQWDGFNT